MHEFSIAEAVLDIARGHVPADCVLTAVRVEAGPMRGIEPDAMQWAWQALMAAEELGEVRLDLTVMPWRLECHACGRVFHADDAIATCVCGCQAARPVDCDHLRLVSIDIDNALERSVCRASQSD